MAKSLQPNTPQAIAAAWDNLCGSYTQDLDDLAKRKALAAVELAAIRRELADCKGLRILDAGCGPGFHGIQLALDGHSLLMVDLSAKMLDRARTAAQAANIQDRITFCQDDIRNLSQVSDSFDAIISCGTAVSDCGDPDAALSEFSRLLKNTGIALFSARNLLASLDSQNSNASLTQAQHWTQSGRRLIPQGHQAFDWTLFTPHGLKIACRSAGLQLQRIYPVAILPPPQDEKTLPSYVQFHLTLADHGPALAKAHELLPVGVRPKVRRRRI